MNLSIKSVGVGLIIAVVAMLVIPGFGENRAHAQTPVVEEQYKIIEMRSTGPLFETALNQLAKDGWKVRTSINGTYLILAK